MKLYRLTADCTRQDECRAIALLDDDLCYVVKHVRHTYPCGLYQGPVGSNVIKLPTKTSPRGVQMSMVFYDEVPTDEEATRLRNAVDAFCKMDVSAYRWGADLSPTLGRTEIWNSTVQRDFKTSPFDFSSLLHVP